MNPNKSFEGSTALHYAALVDSFDTVKVLLDHGANPSIKNELGYTAYDYVTSSKIRYLPENPAMGELLKKAMADYEERKREEVEEEVVEERKWVPLEMRLHENIIGQDVAVNAVA